jgi:hypothetical protein
MMGKRGNRRNLGFRCKIEITSYANGMMKENALQTNNHAVVVLVGRKETIK